MLLTVPERLAKIDPPVRTLTAEEGVAECRANDGLIIDVREPAEHAASPAEGAINIPRGVIEMKMLELVKDPGKAIYLHCASSARAKLAAEQLRNMGYTNVSVLTCSVETICKACA